MNTIRPAIEELERAFRELSPVFKREMPLPVITIQSKGRKNALGWFAQGQMVEHNGKLPEINICAEHLARSPEDIAEVLLHEMVHYADALDGIPDCTVRQYHNLNFKNRCDEIGLVCRKTHARGWSDTSLSPDLEEKVAKVGINPDAFSLFRAGVKQKKVETKMKKVAVLLHEHSSGSSCRGYLQSVWFGVYTPRVSEGETVVACHIIYGFVLGHVATVCSLACVLVVPPLAFRWSGGGVEWLGGYLNGYKTQQAQPSP